MPQSLDRHGARWKLGLTLLVAVFLAAMAASMVTAARRVSRVVDPDYYSHGLHYGQTGDGARNPGVGYTMTASVVQGLLRVQVSDGSGAPVAGGRLSFQPQLSTADRPLAPWNLNETSPGVFQCRQPASQRGELRGTLRFSRDNALASQKLVLFN